MEISVSGRHIEVSDRLRALAEQKVSRLERFLAMERGEVHFTKHKNPRISDSEVCEVTLEGHGHHVRTKAEASDAFAAVDKAVAKLEHQLSRLKSKLVGRSRSSKAGAPLAAPLDRVPAAGAGPVAPRGEQPRPARIVKSKRFAMMPMTAEDASERMHLLGHGFFFFTNADTGRAAVVYARDDGDVGLIDEAG